jgi:hypothetical protein
MIRVVTSHPTDISGFECLWYPWEAIFALTVVDFSCRALHVPITYGLRSSCDVYLVKYSFIRALNP